MGQALHAACRVLTQQLQEAQERELSTVSQREAAQADLATVKGELREANAELQEAKQQFEEAAAGYRSTAEALATAEGRLANMQVRAFPSKHWHMLRL